MLRRFLPITAAGVLAAGACSSPSQPSAGPMANLGVAFNAPRALLDDVDAMSVYIVREADTQATCGTATGMIEAPGGATGLVPGDLPGIDAVLVPLGRTMPDGSACPNNGMFCTDELSLPTDPDARLVFQAIALKQGAAFAVGCDAAAVNSNPFYVNISMHRYVAPAVCGDGVLQVGEQCEGNGGPPSPDDPFCDQSCKSNEILLSTDHFGPSNIRITNDPPGSKNGVDLAWSVAPDANNPSPLHAVFQDTNFGSTGSGPEVNYRQLSQSVQPIDAPALLSSQLRLPLAGGAIPGFDQRPRTQGAPAIATMTDGSIVVAYEDDRTSANGQLNISFTAMSVDVAVPRPDEVYINKQGINTSSDPDVAGGPTDRALVVWTDTAARRVRGRFWAPTGWLSTSDKTISVDEADQPATAGWNEGWIVAWHGRSPADNDDIVFVPVATTGNLGGTVVVNTANSGLQEHPAVAMLPTGEFIIAWSDGGNIRMQRYDRNRAAIAGDQDVPLNDRGQHGDADFPAVAGSSLAAGFYIIAWQTAAGTIRARLVDTVGGSLFNAVDGQDGDFEVSRPELSGQRSRPSLAIGGSGQIVVAWQDDAPARAGIYARRFPLPQR